jgi:translocation and assembly module TamB
LRRLNKILIVFFAFSFLTIFGAWRFIHSRNFSQKASLKVSEILTKKFGAKLEFTGVDFSLFPPATIFKNVHIIKNDPTLVDLDLSIEELGVSFTYSSFFSSNLEIDNLLLKKGTLTVVTHDKGPATNWKDLDFNKIYKKYSEYYQKSPLHLNLMQMENILATIDKSHLEVLNLSVAPHRKEVRLKINAKEIHVDAAEPNIAAIDLDKAELLVNLTKDTWKVESLKIEKGDNSIESKLSLFNAAKTIQSAGETTFDIDLAAALKLYPSLPKELIGTSGRVHGSVSTSGNIFDPEAIVELELSNLKSKWIMLERVDLQLKKKKNFIVLEKLKAINKSENYELLKSQPVFDLKKLTLLHSRFPLFLRDSFTNTFLYSLKGSLEGLKGYLTGKIEIVWDGEKVYFVVNDKLQVKEFKLLTSSKKTILQNPGFTLEDTVLELDKKLKLGINAKLLMKNTKVHATGEITGKELNISIKDSKIDMQAFGPISGIAISGNGPASAEIYGPFDNVKFDFIVDWNNFSLLSLNFGKVKSEFTLGLKDLEINVHQLSGLFNQSNFNAEGTLGFGDKSGMDLKIDFKNSNFADAQKMYNLVFKNIKLPVEPEFNFSASYRVRGGYSVDSLKIDGLIKGTDLKVLNEEAEQLSLNFTLQNSLLNFKDIKIKKSRGEIGANVSVNLTNNYTELEGSLQGFRLSDFAGYRKLNMEYDGDLAVEFDGNGTKENFSSRFKSKVTNAFIQNVPASPSNAIFYINANDIVVNANILSGKIKVDSLLNLKTRMISLKSTVESSDMKEVLGILAGHNISDKGITGKIKARLISEFNMDSLAIKKFFLDFYQFNLKKGEINIQVDPKHNSVAIDDSIIKNWDLRFLDGEDFFISKAVNRSSGMMVFDQTFSLKTSLLEFGTGAIDKALGVLKGSTQIVVDKKLTVSKFEIKGINNSFKIRNLPGAVTELDFNIQKRGDTFELSRLVGKYGEGDLKATGVFVFDDMYPDVNIDYKIERATIPLFKRSNILASSSGTITGTDLPYKLNGKVTLLHGEFLDDPSDFTKDRSVSLESFKKYLPRKSSAEKKGYLNLNVSFDTANLIVLKNNLAEVYAKGSGQLSGDVLSPEINARVEVAPGISKFKFKGHDFVLNQGYVEIRDRGKTRASDLKFVGLSKVNDYDVKLDISGSIETTQISLSSEPPLAQEDLVALLTLGVTSDMSKNLEANDRKSVTTVGIGTLLVDQLKINEDLNTTLGLNLSVLPEFKEDETSLVTGKAAVSDSSTSRLKSSTKIKLQKHINKMVDVSVSSTVGGSIEQTQEMNVNFNINKNFSIEGVYEVKPAEEENTNTPNSVGADLKFRGSF